jgi:hypothetical protein
VGIRDRLRRAERAAAGDMVVVPQRDGSVKRFPQRALFEALSRTWERSRAHSAGEIESAPPPHPFTVALQNAPEDALEALLEREGWGWGVLVSEEEVYTGRAERPGPPVTWNDEGTVCW